MLPRSVVTRVLLAAVAGTLVAAVPARAAGGALPGLYVAMGDSYTAGPLIPNQLPDPPGCWRSDHNYPHLVAAAQGAALRDVSCSGASTADLTSPQLVLGGPNPPQLHALDSSAAMVSLQIGGNDMGFAEILHRCFAVLPLGTPCQDHYRPRGVDELSRRIVATAPRVRAAEAALEAMATDG